MYTTGTLKETCRKKLMFVINFDMADLSIHYHVLLKTHCF